MIIASAAAKTRINAEPLNEPIEEFDLLDFSYRGLSALPEFVIANAHLVKHLILDGNHFDEHVFDNVRFPVLETLSFNCNQINNIGVFIQFLSHKCPELRFLSLIGNPGWPHALRNDNLKLYSKYIRTVLKFFPSLRFLDSADVTSHRKISTASCVSVLSACSSTSSSSSSSSSSSE
ncbi:Leucine-rich repeat-containing protein C10orf11 [Aphelenchoides bicaudatus]|nr:Leucine-rich repeat-containing protein C10orf11 [Aphelenchoides bicaudatus]